MSDKKNMKYTFFLKNDNKIVLSDKGNLINSREKIQRMVKLGRKNITCVFSTDTDLAIFFPQSISAIHISKLSDDMEYISEEEPTTTNTIEETEQYIIEEDDVDYENNSDIKLDLENKLSETTNFMNEFSDVIEEDNIDLEDESIEEFSKLNDLSDE